MSLFLEERIKEQTQDPANDKIVFTYPRIITIDIREGPIFFSKSFRTSYSLGTEKWTVKLLEHQITIHAKGDFFGDQSRAWNGSSCFISYDLFYDNDMRFLRYSSSRIKMEERGYSFRAPDKFLSKFYKDVVERERLRIVFHIELHLPVKWFYRPFDNPEHAFSEKLFDEYPADLENHYKFTFLKWSDYSIKCSDGAIPALKMLLNATSKFMFNHFKETNGNELTVDCSMDVLKPVIYCLHSRCFEMPASYNLDFAQRLLDVVDYFEPEQILPIRKAVHQSLCRKFADKKTYTFNSLLTWLSVACQNSFFVLAKMITLLIADKYFFKWHQIFPENARNVNNPIFLDVFGSQEDFDDEIGAWVFARIDTIILDTFKCNVILP